MNKIMKNTIYNTVGSFVYLFSQWVMSILVVRLSGSYEEAGVFSTALSVTNVFYVIATFSIRNYQVADINGRFSNGEYVLFRIFTCALSFVLLPLYLIVMRYSLYTALSVMCYMIIKIAEAMIDVLQGIFQKAWRLDIVCKSLVIRGIVNLAIFSITEWYFKNLVIALLLASIASLICGIIFDLLPCRTMFNMEIRYKRKRLCKLFMCGLPVFVHGFLSVLIYNVPRIVAQKICGDELFGYYSSVAAPTVIIQLAVSCVFSPIISLMAEQYAKREKKLVRTILAVQGIIIIVGICAVAGFSLLGDVFLKVAFGEEVLDYRGLLLPAVVAALLIAVTAFIASVLVALNRNVIMMILEVISFIAVLILSFVLIREYALQGINYALMLSCVLFIVTGYCAVIMGIRKEYKNFSEKNN